MKDVMMVMSVMAVMTVMHARRLPASPFSITP